MSTNQESGASSLALAPQAANALPFGVVGIGASAGGLEAVMALLRALPDDPGLALVVIIHLAADRPSSLAEVLSRTTQLPVAEAVGGMRVERNHVYVIPPNAEIRVVDGTLRLRPRPAGQGQFKPVDAFFLSLAEAEKTNAVGVVLSGADSDGKRGLQAIKRAGGVTFAQDETAKVGGMPESSIATGAVDFILPPDAIAHELVRLSGQAPAPAPSVAREVVSAGPAEAELTEEQYLEVVELLHSAIGVDLSEYKQSTVRRRILRRMGLHRIHDAEEFMRLLRANPAELKSLHADILIHVTSFFRDAEAFHALRTLAIPRLVERARHARGEALRIWVPGCATGEEVYSIAMCVLEALGDAAESVLLQIFGTDISEAAIVKARAGSYAEDIQAELTPEQLRRFFVKTDSGYQVCKAVRDVCVFAVHDVARDPPFSRLDLISCRNVLIYMSPLLQKRVIPLFHYGLVPEGYLLLGAAETVGVFSDLFTAVDQRWKLYARAEGGARPVVPRAPFERAVAREASPDGSRVGGGPPAIDLEKEAARFLLSAYAPAGVVINEQMEVLYVLGRTGPYLELPPGKTSYHLLSMAREGLRAGIFRAVRGSLEANAPIELPVRIDSDGRELEIRVVPLGADRSASPRYRLVIFGERQGASPPALPVGPAPAREAGAEEVQVTLARSRDELDALRLHLQGVIEGYEAAHEELQSANEEILSSNEELQSTNEELQTTKEEVEATNEELSTVNDELQARIAELARLNDDLANVLASVQIPIVILSQDLRIRSFTPAAAPLFNLIGSDVGRPLSDINIGVAVPNLLSLLVEVLDTLSSKTIDVQERTGRWYTLRMRPYRTQDNKIDGVVLALVDVDEIKRATEQVAAARDYAEAIVATVHHPLLVLDSTLRVNTANPEFYRTFEVSREESEGRLIYELGNRQWDIPELRERLQEALASSQEVKQFEVEHSFPRIGRRIMLIHARRVVGKDGAVDLILVAIDDITERRQQERVLEERDRELLIADTRKNEFLAMLAHELRNPLAPIVHAGSLLSTAKGADSASVERATEIIMRQSSHMARLIEDLLDVSRITRGRVELRRQPVDLRACIEGAVDAARPLMQARRHELQVSLPPEALEVDADPARLEQVIGNLLNNAARYTEAGGRIELSAEREAGWLVMRVRDNGIGIAAEMLPRVFDLFAQADTELDHRAGGLGIGLTVVRSLVEMHGGSIEARSPGRGQGSEFIMRLPALGSPVSPAPTSLVASSRANEARPPAKQRPHRVLLVEDNEDAAEALCALLGAWGHDAHAVSDGPAALEVAGVMRPDVILLDIGLPGTNGYEVARQLRQLPGLEGARIVAMTGYGQEEDRRRSQAAGFDEHLVKPVTPEDLQALFARSRAD